MGNYTTNLAIANQQLKNVAKLLNGKLIRTVRTEDGRVIRAVIIEYADPTETEGE